jgi:hypothetical protein
MSKIFRSARPPGPDRQQKTDDVFKIEQLFWDEKWHHFEHSYVLHGIFERTQLMTYVWSRSEKCGVARARDLPWRDLSLFAQDGLLTIGRKRCMDNPLPFMAMIQRHLTNRTLRRADSSVSLLLREEAPL